MIDIDAHLAPLNLPQHIHARAARLLLAIAMAHDLYDILRATTRATTRAEGFGLGLETVKALDPESIKGLYLAFEAASQARQAELKP
ncbi:hypothetical protein NHG97_16110 [Pseudomonas corrugata]|uniref:hypothetical protein n=1 Tax=Pseudomonas corrugata TaxID=47879 RepID=UPI0028C46915|nr:hypothetical protein [Pseudomonas corrugata]MDU9040222.1 hypothetical protein [Pseudomonas corrugata]